MGKHTINWDNYPPVGEYTDMGDTNGNKLNIAIEGAEDRVAARKKKNWEKVDFGFEYKKE